MSKPFETPVAVFMYNRPQLTKDLINVLEKVQPSHLLLVADGPQSGNDEDAEKCTAVRSLFENLNWNCQIDRNFAESNMGSFPRNSSGLNWVFETVEEAIVLEDDCIPDPSFFPYCAALLEKYRFDKNIGLISGNNFLSLNRDMKRSSYYFSRYATTWGWASWRRTWQQVELGMPYWTEFRDSGALRSELYTRKEERYWRWIYDGIQSGQRRNAWDYQLILTCLKNNLLTVVPATNLVSNLGFGSDATHCLNDQSPLSGIPTGEVFLPLIHPKKTKASLKKDYLIFNRRFGGNHFRSLAEFQPNVASILIALTGKFGVPLDVIELKRIYHKLPDPLKPVLRMAFYTVRAGKRELFLRTRIAWNKIKRMFVPVVPPSKAEGKIYLHLGCGPVDHKKFINVDGYPYPHVHYVQAIERLPQFKEGSVDLIYGSHCLEHFKYSETLSVLKEWHRVLKPGGIIRLSVPDFDKLVDIYKTQSCDPDTILPQLMGGQNNKYNYHLTIFNKVNLSRILKETGFGNISEWEPGTDDLTTFNDYSIFKKKIGDKSYEISLNIEAVKL